ncbi:MAG: mechanosensitive ion channel [Anaerolineales bacterium]|nr:mechanosensitive ion channel [Anaerolineales bacterium]
MEVNLHPGGWYTAHFAQAGNEPPGKQIGPFLQRVLLALMVVVALIIVLDHFNIEVGASITTLGVGSLAVALAVQETLSDTISGFLILINRPFQIGDRIEIRDLGTWVDVEIIGLQTTQIRTRDNPMVVVPNSVITKSLVVNHTFPEAYY